jgi:hypothetical protein
MLISVIASNDTFIDTRLDVAGIAGQLVYESDDSGLRKIEEL